MDKKYKCHNRNKYDVGIRFMDGIRQLNVRAGSFVSLSEDEISYMHSISSTFSGKDLSIDEPEIRENVLGFMPDEKVFLTEKEIITILKSAFPKMKKELETITEPNFKFSIFEEAKKMYADLTGAKIEFIAEFCGKDPEDMKPAKEEKETSSKTGK